MVLPRLQERPPYPSPLFRYSSLAREVYCHRIVFRLFSSSMHRPPLNHLCPRCHLRLSADIPSSGSLAYHWQKRISLPETYPYCLLKLSVQYDNSRQNGLYHIIHLVSYFNNCFRVQRYGFYFKCQSFIIVHCSLYFFFFFSIRGLRLTRLHISTFLNHICIFYDLHIPAFTHSHTHNLMHSHL